MTELEKAEKMVADEIASLESRMELARAKLDHLLAAKAIVESMPADHNGHTDAELEPARNGYRPRRSITGLNDAILSVVEKYGRGQLIKPTDVCRLMVKDGFRPTTPNFKNVVGNSLRRFGKRGVIHMEQRAYGSAYGAKS